MPLRQIMLLVTFGTPNNFWTEFIKFEVADFESSYQSSVDLLWPSSWLFYTTRTSCSKYKVLMVYSPSEVTSSAHTTVTRKLSRLQPQHNKPMKHRRLPTSHNRLSQKTWKFWLRR
jgi:hypothetical protein